MATRYAGTAGVAPLWRRGEASPRSPLDRRGGRPRREREVEERAASMAGGASSTEFGVRSSYLVDGGGGGGTIRRSHDGFQELRAQGIGTGLRCTWTRSR